MGSSSTKTVGGQPTTAVSRNFTDFLNSSIGQGGDFQTALNGLLSGSTGNTPSNISSYFNSLPNSGNFSAPTIGIPNPTPGQTIGTAGSTPTIGTTPTNVAAPANLNPANFLASTPTGGNLDVSKLLGGSQANLPSGVDLASILNNGNNLSLPGAANTTNNTGGLDLASILKSSNLNLPGNVASAGTPGTVNANLPDLSSLFKTTNLSTLSADDPEVKSIQDIVNRNINDQALNLREGFTAQGGGAGFGTGAQYAEGTLRSQIAPMLTSALGDLSRSRSGLELQAGALNSQNASQIVNALLAQQQAGVTQRGQDISASTTGREQDVTQRGQDISASLQKMGIDANTAQALAANLVQQRGQDVSATTASNEQQIAQRGQDITAILQKAGLDASTASTLASTLVSQRGQDVGAALQQAGLNQQGVTDAVNAILAGRGQDLSAGTATNATNSNILSTILGSNNQNLGNILNYLTQNRSITSNEQSTNATNAINNTNTNRGLDIQSLLGTGQQGLDLASLIAGVGQNNATNALNAQNLNQNYNLGEQNLGLNLAQLTQSGQLSALAQLFASLNGANALGTPQSQTVQQKSGFSNFVDALTGISGAVSGVKAAF